MQLARQQKTEVQPAPLTAAQLADRFYASEVNRNFMICPNVNVDHWSECDILAIATSGYAVEVEIKVTRDDYRRDFNKVVRWRRDWFGKRHGPRIEEKKHAALFARDCFPNRFYFFTPEGLLNPDELPDWAGLYELTADGRVRKIKAAPLLHKQKPDDALLCSIARKFVFRYWDGRRRSK